MSLRKRPALVDSVLFLIKLTRSYFFCLLFIGQEAAPLPGRGSAMRHAELANSAFNQESNRCDDDDTCDDYTMNTAFLASIGAHQAKISLPMEASVGFWQLVFLNSNKQLDSHIPWALS